MGKKACDIDDPECKQVRDFNARDFVDNSLPEFFGTFLFALFGGASSNTTSGVGLNGAFGNGITLAAVLWMLSNEKGGGKLNPAVSVMIYLTHVFKSDLGSGQWDTVKHNAKGFFAMVLEVGCQIAGAYFAGYTLDHLLPNPKDSCFIPNVTDIKLFTWEFFGAFLLIGVIRSLNKSDEIQRETYKAIGPLVIGLALFSGAQAAGPFTGAAFNPARYLGNLGVKDCNASKAGWYVGAHMTAAFFVCFITFMQSGADEVANRIEWWRFSRANRRKQEKEDADARSLYDIPEHATDNDRQRLYDAYPRFVKPKRPWHPDVQPVADV